MFENVFCLLGTDRGPNPAREDILSIMKKSIYEKHVDLVECSIS